MLPRGAAPSAWAGERLAALRNVDPQPWVDGNGDGSGFTAEFACLNDTPASFRAMLPHLDDEPLGTALWQVFVDQPHPQLGSGALLTLKLPGSIGVEEVAVTANAVNASERARLASPAFGAWTRDPSDPKSLVHVTFLPSLLSRPGLLENLSIYEMIRSRFAAEAVYGGVGDSTAG